MPPTKTDSHINEDIIELVQLLNNLARVDIYASPVDFETEFVTVYVHYEGNYRESAEFANTLKRTLLEHIPEHIEVCPVIISLIWLGDDTEPILTIEIPLDEISNIIQILAGEGNVSYCSKEYK